jgi:hypothetical protein
VFRAEEAETGRALVAHGRSHWFDGEGIAHALHRRH